MYCPECGAKIVEADARYCSDCGAKLQECQEEEWEANLKEGYCPECGAKIEEEDACFCSDCGAKLQPCQKKQGKETPMAEHVHGLIFTNLKLLAQSLHESPKNVSNVLETYMEIKRKHGVVYQLIDAGNYTYKKKTSFWGRKTVHLEASNDWSDYTDILMDIHDYEVNSGLPESQYLFIIGGADVIPMPRVPYFVKKMDDKTIDTDMLYAYPYGKKVLSMLEGMEILRYKQLFYTGRLPLGTDTTFADFCDYFQRAAANAGGVPMKEAYAQCDPHWKYLVSVITEELAKGRYLRNLEDTFLPGLYDKGISLSEIYHQGIILSPKVTVATLKEVFHSSASFYFYCLHGSNALNTAGYLGESIKPRAAYSVIYPSHMNGCRQPNVVMTEACYGARFIGMDKEHSMLLSSIYGKTLAFTGSSRIAWGAGGAIYGGKVIPLNADVLAKCYIAALLSGLTVGQALLLGKYGVAQSVDKIGATNAVTIAEFNLFGDPTVRLSLSRESKYPSLDNDEFTVTKDSRIAEQEEVQLSSEAGSGSILEQVRHAVDMNIFQIHELVGLHLYREYGMEPRPATHILKLKYSDGTKALRFDYHIPTDDVVNVYSVKTTERGEIIHVMTTR